MLLLEVATCIIIYILVLLPIAAASDGGLRRRPPAVTSPASFVRSATNPSTPLTRIFNRSPSVATFFTSFGKSLLPYCVFFINRCRHCYSCIAPILIWVCLFGGGVVCSLRQWLEYSSKGKKHTCPICKQGCRASDACWLYFQSVGDANDSVKPQKSFELEEDAGVPA